MPLFWASFTEYCPWRLLIGTAPTEDVVAVWPARRWDCAFLTGAVGVQGSARVIRCLQDHREELQIECSTALYDQEVRGRPCWTAGPQRQSRCMQGVPGWACSASNAVAAHAFVVAAVPA
jgi:hypothetical protein